MARDHPQIRRNGAYVPLSVSYADDDAIAALDEMEDDRSELLFLRGMAFSGRDPSLDGFISSVALRTGRVLRRKPRRGQDITCNAERLAEVGLWVPEENGYRIRSWVKWNRSSEEIAEARKRDAVRKGGKGGTDDAN